MTQMDIATFLPRRGFRPAMGKRRLRFQSKSLQRYPRSQARIGNSESVDQRDCIRADLGTERGDQSANCLRLKARHYAVLQVPAFMQLEMVERKKIA